MPQKRERQQYGTSSNFFEDDAFHHGTAQDTVGEAESQFFNLVSIYNIIMYLETNQDSFISRRNKQTMEEVSYKKSQLFGLKKTEDFQQTPEKAEVQQRGRRQQTSPAKNFNQQEAVEQKPAGEEDGVIGILQLGRSRVIIYI